MTRLRTSRQSLGRGVYPLDYHGASSPSLTYPSFHPCSFSTPVSRVGQDVMEVSLYQEIVSQEGNSGKSVTHNVRKNCQ